MLHIRMIRFLLHIIHLVQFSTACQTIGNIWTYYPCSFIIASLSTNSHCSQTSITLSIDDCLNQDVTFFWNFPTGNMTLIFETDTNVSFTLRLLENSSFNRNVIRNVYHLDHDQTITTSLLDQNENQVITISSEDEQHRCLLMFESYNELIVDYGTFIRMTIITDLNDTF